MTEATHQPQAFGIGPHHFRGRVLLAPMSGVTDLAMRRIASRLGASAVVSEMVACDSYVRREAETMLRAAGEGVSPHIVQLAGRDPAWMADAARLAVDAGAAVVDINMGCPAKRVTGGYAGAALMRDPDLAARIIATVVAAAGAPVTVKMRLGWDSGSLNAPALARRAQDLGVALVTVHGRTRDQFYKGAADWRAVRAVVEAVTVPVVVNGDVASTAQASAAMAQSGAAAVMVGRAALGQPWLPGEIAAALDGERPRTLTAAERADIAVEHYEGLLSLFGVELGLRHARKHVAAYMEAAGVGPELRLRAVTSADPKTVRGLLRRAFEEPATRLAA